VELGVSTPPDRTPYLQAKNEISSCLVLPFVVFIAVAGATLRAAVALIADIGVIVSKGTASALAAIVTLAVFVQTEAAPFAGGVGTVECPVVVVLSHARGIVACARLPVHAASLNDSETA
jgi:hypothetical protein